MRKLVILATALVVIAIGYEIKHVFFTPTPRAANAAAAPNTLSPHDIHLDYKGMEKLPVHDVKDAD